MVPGSFLWFFRVPGVFFMVIHGSGLVFHGSRPVFMVPGWLFMVPGRFS